MKVIRFPRGEDRKKALQKEETEMSPIFLGPFSFTCPCGTKGQIQPQNMIFRSMEFYCTKCGAAHKVTNPAFVPPRPIKTK